MLECWNVGMLECWNVGMLECWNVGMKLTLQPSNKKGEMSEWSKEHAWKVCIPQKGIQGSNPCLSANQLTAWRAIANRQ